MTPLALADAGPLLDGVLHRRVLAWLIDLLVLAVIAGALFLLGLLFGLITLGFGLPLLGLLPLVPLVYHVLFTAGRGAATPGQRVMDLTTRTDADFGRPNLIQAVVFTAGLYLTLTAGVLWLLVALFTVRRRTLHDLVSGLVVVRAKALTRLSVSPRLRPIA